MNENTVPLSMGTNNNNNSLKHSHPFNNNNVLHPTSKGVLKEKSTNNSNNDVRISSSVVTKSTKKNGFSNVRKKNNSSTVDIITQTTTVRPDQTATENIPNKSVTEDNDSSVTDSGSGSFTTVGTVSVGTVSTNSGTNGSSFSLPSDIPSKPSSIVTIGTSTTTSTTSIQQSSKASSLRSSSLLTSPLSPRNNHSTTASSVPKIQRRRNYSLDNSDIIHSTNVSIMDTDQRGRKELPETPRLVITRSSLTYGSTIGAASPLSVTKRYTTNPHTTLSSPVTVSKPPQKGLLNTTTTTIPIRKTVSADSPRTKDSNKDSFHPHHHHPHDTTPKHQTGRHNMFISYLLDHGQENTRTNLQQLNDNNTTNDQLPKRTGGGFLCPSLESKEPIIGQEAAKRRIILAARRPRPSTVSEYGEKNNDNDAISTTVANQGLCVTGHTLQLQEFPLTNSAVSSPVSLPGSRLTTVNDDDVSTSSTTQENYISNVIQEPATYIPETTGVSVDSVHMHIVHHISLQPSVKDNTQPNEKDTVINLVNHIPRVTSFKRPREIPTVYETHTDSNAQESVTEESVYTTDSVSSSSCTSASLTESIFQTDENQDVPSVNHAAIQNQNILIPSIENQRNTVTISNTIQASEWSSVTFASPTNTTTAVWGGVSSSYHITVEPFPSLSQYVTQNHPGPNPLYNNNNASILHHTNILSTVINNNSLSTIFPPESMQRNNDTLTNDTSLNTTATVNSFHTKKVNLKERARIRMTTLVPTLTVSLPTLTEPVINLPIESENNYPETIQNSVKLPPTEETVTSLAVTLTNVESIVTNVPEPSVPPSDTLQAPIHSTVSDYIIQPNEIPSLPNLPTSDVPVETEHHQNHHQHSEEESSVSLTFNESPVKRSAIKSPHSVSHLSRSPAVHLQSLSIDLSAVSVIMDGDDHSWNNTQSMEHLENVLPSIPRMQHSSPIKSSMILPLSVSSSPIPLIASPHIHHGTINETSPCPTNIQTTDDNVKTVPFFGYKTKSRIELLSTPEKDYNTDQSLQESVFPITEGMNILTLSPFVPKIELQNNQHDTSVTDSMSTASSIHPYNNYNTENEQNHSLAGTTTIMQSLSPILLPSLVTIEEAHKNNYAFPSSSVTVQQPSSSVPAISESIIDFPIFSTTTVSMVPLPVSLGYTLPSVKQILSVAICKTKIQGNFFTRHAIHTLHTVYLSPLLNDSESTKYRYQIHHNDIRYRDILHLLEILREKIRIYSTTNLSSDTYQFHDKLYTVSDIKNMYNEFCTVSVRFPQKCLNSLAKNTLMERRKGIQRMFRFFIDTELIYTREVMEILGFI